MHLGDHKDFSFDIFANVNKLLNANNRSLLNKVHLRTSYKNAVFSAGVEDWDIHDVESGRLPKKLSFNTSYIHDQNENLRLYAGAKFGIGKTTGYGFILGGFNYLRKYRLVVVAGGDGTKTVIKNENENSMVEYKFSPSVKVIARSMLSDKLETHAELNVNKCGEKFVPESAVAAEYSVDSKSKIKGRICSQGDIVWSYLHNFGIINFGIFTRVSPTYYFY